MSGCVHYQARPIDPAATVERLDVRTLADPGLARAVEPAHLSGTWPPEVWDLEALTLAGLYFHPDLAVARASWGVTRAGIVIAGEKPNPGVNAGPGYNSSTPAATITPWILNLDLDFTIETAGKRRFRIDEARRLSESARYKIADMAWQVRARIRQALLDLFTSTEVAAALDRQRVIQENNVVLFQRAARVRDRVGRGHVEAARDCRHGGLDSVSAPLAHRDPDHAADYSSTRMSADSNL